MRWHDLQQRFRYDGLWWRKLAALGAVYGPEWWKRYSPPAIGAICFLLIGRNRRGAIANLRRVLAPGTRSPVLAALEMFSQFAFCISETLERFGPSPAPVRVDIPGHDHTADAIAAGTGAIVVTAHFGNWDIAALTLRKYECPVHIVMAHEENASTNPWLQDMREQWGLRIFYSDRSVLSSLTLLQALRRNEIVALQLDRPPSSDNVAEVELFGAPVPLPIGPFELARLSGAPLIPVFAPRVGARRYEVHIGAPRHIARRASRAALLDTMRGVAAEIESAVAQHPTQWFQFAPLWPDADPRAAAPPGETRRSRAARIARG